MDTPLSNAAADLLGFFGIAAASDYDRVRDAVVAECARLGITADVAELRWGRLWVSCPAPLVGLLRTHCDRLLVVAESAAPGTVSQVGIRPTR
jgi:hypothetical protein